jgi:hypothetical protein
MSILYSARHAPGILAPVLLAGCSPAPSKSTFCWRFERIRAFSRKHEFRNTNFAAGDFAPKQSRDQALAILSRLTQPQLGEQTRQGRLEFCLRDPGSEISPGWFMHVPRQFNDALDIRQTERVENGVKKTVWTQGGNFSFKPGDMIHDTEKGCLFRESQ